MVGRGSQTAAHQPFALGQKFKCGSLFCQRQAQRAKAIPHTDAQQQVCSWYGGVGWLLCVFSHPWWRPGQIVKEMTGRKRMTKQIVEDLIEQSRHEELARLYLFDPRVWLEVFRGATTKAQRDALRLVVLTGTRNAALEEHYWVVPGKDVVNARRVPSVTHAHTVRCLFLLLLFCC